MAADRQFAQTSWPLPSGFSSDIAELLPLVQQRCSSSALLSHTFRRTRGSPRLAHSSRGMAQPTALEVSYGTPASRIVRRHLIGVSAALHNQGGGAVAAAGRPLASAPPHCSAARRRVHVRITDPVGSGRSSPVIVAPARSPASKSWGATSRQLVARRRRSLRSWGSTRRLRSSWRSCPSPSSGASQRCRSSRTSTRSSRPSSGRSAPRSRPSTRRSTVRAVAPAAAACSGRRAGVPVARSVTPSSAAGHHAEGAAQCRPFAAQRRSTWSARASSPAPRPCRPSPRTRPTAHQVGCWRRAAAGWVATQAAWPPGLCAQHCVLQREERHPQCLWARCPASLGLIRVGPCW